MKNNDIEKVIREHFDEVGFTPEEHMESLERLALLLFQTSNTKDEQKKVEDFLAIQKIDDKYLIENTVDVCDPLPNTELKNFRDGLPDDIRWFMPSLVRLDGISFENGMVISVQAGQSIRSLPSRAVESRADIANFTHFEVAAPPEFVEPYKEYWDVFLSEPSYGIYNFVPKKLIELTIAKADEKFVLEQSRDKKELWSDNDGL